MSGYGCGYVHIKLSAKLFILYAYSTNCGRFNIRFHQSSQVLFSGHTYVNLQLGLRQRVTKLSLWSKITRAQSHYLMPFRRCICTNDVKNNRHLEHVYNRLTRIGTKQTSLHCAPTSGCDRWPVLSKRGIALLKPALECERFEFARWHQEFSINHCIGCRDFLGCTSNRDFGRYYLGRKKLCKTNHYCKNCMPHIALSHVSHFFCTIHSEMCVANVTHANPCFTRRITLCYIPVRIMTPRLWNISELTTPKSNISLLEILRANCIYEYSCILQFCGNQVVGRSCQNPIFGVPAGERL